MASVPPKPQHRDDIRIAIICALPLEAELVQSVFDKDWIDEHIDLGQAEGDQNAYTIGAVGRHNVVLAYMPGIGLANAATVAAGLRSSYHRIEIAFVVGICGVTPKHPDTGSFKRKTALEETHGRANATVRAAVSKLQTAPNLERLSLRMQHHLEILQQNVTNLQYPGWQADWLFKTSYTHEHYDSTETCVDCEKDTGVCRKDCQELGCKPSELIQRQYVEESRLFAPSINPRVHFGRYGSANTVLKCGEQREHLVREDKIVAFEMEGAGVWDSLPTILVKSACDYADSHKNKRWQRYAAATAAAGLKSILEFWRVTDIVRESEQETYAAHADRTLSELICKADQLLHDHYRSAGRLLINRLSGQELDLDKCFINLALTDRSGGTKDQDQEKSFSLDARLRLDASVGGQSTSSDSISLDNLFQSRRLTNGKTISPRRIFIQGRAGIGKTTLCKKIVHEFLEKRIEQTLFQRLIWIPLRGLQPNQRKEYGWQELLCDSMKLINPRWKDVRDVYSQQFYAAKFLSTTLFLFDGLDEISHEWKDDLMCNFLNTILRAVPNVIITSRPHANTFNLEQFDLDLETVGFTPDQVSIYIRNCVNSETAAKMENFITQKPLLRGLLRIPIQLDAFCYTWNENEEDRTNNDSFADSGQSTADILASGTMTMLYQSIVNELCKKDIRNLGKVKQQRRLLTSSEVRHKLKTELALLGQVAFQGMLNNIVEFHPKHCDRIGSYLYESSPGVESASIFDSAFERLSFLRTSGCEMDYTKRNLHFIHLTFQEFFAAKHFIEKWQQDQPLVCLQLTGPADHREKPPFTFLQEEKYNPRYNIFWRFVSGLASAKHNVVRFFQQLYDNPVDLIGSAHLRLLMYCFSEVDSYPDQNLQELCIREAELLKRGLVQEYCATSRAMLGAATEYSEGLLREFLRNDFELPYIVTLGILAQRSVLQAHTIEAIAGMVNPNYTMMVQVHAAGGLLKHSSICSYQIKEHAIDTLIRALKKEDHNIRVSAGRSLLYSSSLPERAIDALLLAYQDENESVRELAVWSLGKQTSLPEKAIYTLGAALNDSATDVVDSATQALERHSPLREAAVDGLVSIIKEGYVGDYVMMVLERQSSLPESAIDLLVTAVRGNDSSAQHRAIAMLEEQPSLPESAIEALLTVALEDDVRSLREAAIQALKKQSPLPQFAINALERQTSSQVSLPDSLDGQLSPTELVIHNETVSLRHHNQEVRHHAILVFNHYSSLPKRVIETLEAVVKDDEWWLIRSFAASALGRQLSIPQRTINTLIEALTDVHYLVRKSAAEALGWQLSLPERAIRALIIALKDDEEDVRKAAGEALKKHSALSEYAVDILVTMLADENFEVYDVLHHQKLFFQKIEAFSEEDWIKVWSYWREQAPNRDISCYVLHGALYVWSSGLHYEISTNPNETFRLLKAVLRIPDDDLWRQIDTNPASERGIANTTNDNNDTLLVPRAVKRPRFSEHL